MPSLRVFILTTNGPSRLVYLGPELTDSGVNSAVRVDGDIQPLPISTAYADFIDTVVQRFSGHRVYRADVSHSIYGGRSWQLGMLTAHWIFETPGLSLAIEDEPADLDLFVSGEVRDRPGLRQIEVLPVSSISIKLDLAKKAISDAVQKGRRAYVILPRENKNDFDDCAASKALVPACQSVFCHTFGELTNILSTDSIHDISKQGPIKSDSTAIQPKPFKLKLISGLTILATAGALYFSDASKSKNIQNGNGSDDIEYPAKPVPVYAANQTPDKLGIYVTFNAIVPEDRRDCSGNRFRNSPDILVADTEPMKTRVTLERGEAVCGFLLSVSNHLGQHVRAAAHLFRATSEMKLDGPETSSIDPQTIKPDGSIDMQLDLPRFRTANEHWLFIATFKAVAGDADPENAADYYPKIDAVFSPPPDATTYRKHIFLRE